MTYKKERKIDLSIYQAAPDMLVEAIAEAEIKLQGQEKVAGYKFWKSKVNIMRFALGYIEDLNFRIIENQRLRAYNAYLVAENERVRHELGKYCVTEEMLEKKELLEICERIEGRGRIIDQEVKDKIRTINDRT